MKLEIKIDSCNSALADLEEVVRLLRVATRKVQATNGDEDHGKLLDVNGSTVGSWSFSGLDEDGDDLED